MLMTFHDCIDPPTIEGITPVRRLAMICKQVLGPVSSCSQQGRAIWVSLRNYPVGWIVVIHFKIQFLWNWTWGHRNGWNTMVQFHMGFSWVLHVVHA